MKIRDIGKLVTGSVEKNEELQKTITIYEKIEFSKISTESMLAKIKDLEERQVPERKVLSDQCDYQVAQLWFKNWLHPQLKHLFPRASYCQKGCSATTGKLDMKRNILHTYENGQQNYNYSLDDIKAYLQARPDVVVTNEG